MLQRYIIYLEQKKNICYYGNISPFFSNLYYLSDKLHVIFVIMLHKTKSITDAIQKIDNIYLCNKKTDKQPKY
mgnify:FL=1